MQKSVHMIGVPPMKSIQSQLAASGSHAIAHLYAANGAQHIGSSPRGTMSFSIMSAAAAALQHASPAKRLHTKCSSGCGIG